MSEETKSLVPARRGELATVAGASNPLVARGLSELARSGFVIRKEPTEADWEASSSAYWEGKAYWDERELENALAAFSLAISLAPSSGLFGFRAFVWEAMKEYDRAIEDLDKAIRFHPDDPREHHYSNRARILSLKGEYAKAIKDYEEAIRLEPMYQAGIFNCTALATLLITCPELKLRDTARAIELATKACELTDWKSGRELHTLAAAYAEAGQFEEAERYEAKSLTATW